MATRRKPAAGRFARVMALLTAVAGCSPQQADDGGRDVPSVWELDAEPSVVVGLSSDDPEAALYRVTDATRLSDGRIAVATGTLESRLPVFSAEGAYLGSVGRQGDGPGEYRWISSLEAGPNDSLYVYDGALQRLTAFSAAAGARTATFDVTASGTGDPLRVASRLRDGRWAGLGMERPRLGDVGAIVRDTIAIGFMDGGLKDFDVAARVPALMSTTFKVSGAVLYGAPPFGANVVETTWGRCVFVGTGQEPVISVYSSDGALVTKLSGPGTPRAVTEELLASWAEWRLDGVEDEQRAAFRQAYREIPRPSSVPYYLDMVADDRGRLWLQRYVPPEGLGRRWYLVSQTGEHLGDVELPETMLVFEIGESGILGRTKNDLDEEYVKLLPLTGMPFGDGEPLEACRADSGA